MPGDGMTRSFRVDQAFDRFRPNDMVNVSLGPDYLEVEGNEGELRIPYSEIRHVAHCERPEARMMGMTTGAPFLFGQGGSWGALIAQSAVSVGMLGAERAAAPNMYKFLFIVGYDDGRCENWMQLQDLRNYETRPLAQELARLANTRLIHYYAGLQMQSGGYGYGGYGRYY